MCHGAGSLVHAEKKQQQKLFSWDTLWNTRFCGDLVPYMEASRTFPKWPWTTWDNPKPLVSQSNKWPVGAMLGSPFQETHICQSKSSHLCHCRCERSMDILSNSHDSCLHATFACAAGEKISICGQQGPVSSAGFQHATSNNDWSMGPMAMLNLALKSPCYSSMRHSPKDEDFCGFHLFHHQKRATMNASPSNGDRTWSTSTLDGKLIIAVIHASDFTPWLGAWLVLQPPKIQIIQIWVMLDSHPIPSSHRYGNTYLKQPKNSQFSWILRVKPVKPGECCCSKIPKPRPYWDSLLQPQRWQTRPRWQQKNVHKTTLRRNFSPPCPIILVFVHLDQRTKDVCFRDCHSVTSGW